MRGSLARRALIELMEKGLIKQVITKKSSNILHTNPFFFLHKVVAHSSQMIYTRMIGDKEGDDAEAEGGVVVSRNNTHSMLLMATDGSLH